MSVTEYNKRYSGFGFSSKQIIFFDKTTIWQVMYNNKIFFLMDGNVFATQKY